MFRRPNSSAAVRAARTSRDNRSVGSRSRPSHGWSALRFIAPALVALAAGGWVATHLVLAEPPVGQAQVNAKLRYRWQPNETYVYRFNAGGSQILLGQRHTRGFNSFLIGEIDEARFYNRALTPQQVMASYLGGHGARK